MDWVFMSEHSLVEKESDYVIYLLSGTWSEPLDVISKHSKVMTPRQKARYLRLGLEYARNFMQDFEQQVEIESY